MRAVFFGFGLGLLVFSCAPNPPARWAEGGSALVIAPARWDQADGDAIEIRANGQVLEDGALLFVIDRVGRVTDEDYEPVAVLLPDGRLAGPDNRSLGQVGLANAAPPGAVQAWLAITPDGRVTYFDPEGERSAGGVWRGCTGPQQRTCTLVTQLLLLRSYRDPADQPAVGVGVGIGIGF